MVDADIRSFFERVDHAWLMKCIEQRITDPHIQRLIGKYLKAGVLEAGEIEATEEGTPQGSIISPVLANIYLHYVIDLWFVKVVKKQCRGQAEIVRYADDFISCFQYKEDADNFYNNLKARLAKFNLEIAQEKTKILEFGRFARERVKNRGWSKPKIFDFLGFTHYCSTSRHGRFRVKRKTSQKKFRLKVQKFKKWMDSIKHNTVRNINNLIKIIKQKLVGHYRYYGVTDNIRSLAQFRRCAGKIFFRWLNRRSQRRSHTYEEFDTFLERIGLSKHKIYVNIYG